MAQQVKPEPQSAADYDERTTAAVKSVLVELWVRTGSNQPSQTKESGCVLFK